MGKTKDYLGFIPAGNFNIIASGACNIAFVTLDGQEGRYVAVGACEHVIIWDMRRGEKAQVLNGEKSAVTALCANPKKTHLAVGYADGLIQIFDLKSGDMYPYPGHKSAVTCLAYDEEGIRLASGSKDTDIIVWDMLEEKGICRLSGHTGVITKIVFMSELSILITASKDTHVKFWDLSEKSCFKTLVGLGSEVWSIVLMTDDQYLVAATSDKILSIWRLVRKDQNDESDMKIRKFAGNMDISDTHEDDDLTYPLQCYKVGTIARAGSGRTVFMCADISGQLLACHGKDKKIELFQFHSDDTATARLQKRLKRLRKKERSQSGEIKEEESDKIQQLSVQDTVERLKPIVLSETAKASDIILGRGREARVAVCLSDNALELHTLNSASATEEAKCLRNISYLQGHQSDIRAVAFSSDNLAIASGSGESIKSWNRSTQSRVMSIKTGYILSLVFVPGDKHVIAGTKKGHLVIIDIASGEILEEVPAHTEELWSICLTSDLRGCVTGGGDKTVKFWQFELIVDEKSDSNAKVLSVIHSRTLNLEESVLCVRVSNNGKFLAVALLDTTVKIFFVDSFKLFLSLYGHKLPVLTMDISSDSALIATGSADRNVKIWGMDYGNCHKSIFAHDDSITGLQFVPGTHLFFTCGKDGKVKQWDGDSFVKITTLHGHIGEAYGLAVSPNGKFVVSCGSDRVLRLYEKSENIIEIGDQEEMEREEQEPLATGEATVVPGHGELNLPSKKTVSSEKGAETIMEALQVCDEYKLKLEEEENPPLPLIIKAYQVDTIDEYLMKVLEAIRTGDLDQALLLLPFEAVTKLMKYCPELLEKGYDLNVLRHVFMFLLRMHHSAIVAEGELYSTLERFQKIFVSLTKSRMEMFGLNLYRFKYFESELEKSEGMLFKDLTLENRRRNKERQKKEKRKHSMMVLNS